MRVMEMRATHLIMSAAAQEFEAACDDRMRDAVAESPEAFEHARRDVCCRRIDHRVMVGKWNVRQDGAVIVTIERPPSSIVVLHRDEP